MGLKVVYLDIATHDLKSIHKYISMDSKKYASLEVRKIKLFIDSLTQFPLKGKYFETQRGLKIFSIVFRNYIIFYTVSDIQISILSITIMPVSSAIILLSTVMNKIILQEVII